MGTFYAVNKGHKPGIYGNWNDCRANTEGFKGAVYKKFDNLEEARTFLKLGRKTSEFKTYYNIPDAKSNYSKTLSYTPGMEATQGIASKKMKRKQEDTTERTAKYLKKDDYTAVPANTTVVYTDGASSNNGKGHARAGYGVYWGDNDPRNASVRLDGERQTNQRAEATAVIHALKQDQDGTDTLEIRTDSQYVIKAVTEWSKSWIKNGWKSSTGKPVQNKDLFEEILALIKSRKGEVELTYVPGHQGHEGNEKADRLAVKGAEKN